MKKNFKVNMILSILFISIIYSLSISVKTAKADCVDVTQDPCLCDIFDVPYDGWTMHFLWLMYRRDEDKLNYLRTLNIQIDSCNLDYNGPCKTTSMYIEDCLYFKHGEYLRDLEYGFKKEVKAGDTIYINDFDNRDTILIKVFRELEFFICNFRIIVDYYNPNLRNKFLGTILFDSYYKGGTLNEFKDSMKVKGYGSYVSGLTYIPVFDYTTDIDDEEQKDLGFVLRQPNVGELIIHYNQFENNVQVEIYDLLGICQIMSEMNSSSKVLDITHLPRGLYIVRIGSFISKFIRE
jgi:hypothetical protein